MIARPLALAALLASPALAQIKYQPDGLFRKGYADRQIAPGVWEVKGTSGERDGGVAVALYRAAELAAAAKVDTLRVTRQAIRIERLMRRNTYQQVGYSERATVTVRAVRGDADARACDMPQADRCLTLGVPAIMARFGPMIGRPAPAGVAPAPIVSSLFSPAELARINAGRSMAGPAPMRPAPWPPTQSAAPPVVGRPAPMPVAITQPSASELLEQRLRAARPVRGREPTLGWTVSE